MKISELPFSSFLAEWVWSVDSDSIQIDEAADTLTATINTQLCLKYVDSFQVQDFVASGCLAQVVTKVSGIVIIVGACFNKAPTIMNMMEAQSAEGFSPVSMYMEALFYANSSIYSIQHQHPFTAYGENLVLLVQTMVMVYLLWHFSKTTIHLPEKIAVVVLSIGYCVAVTYVLPADYNYLLHAFNDIIIAYSGGLQVYQTYQIQHTGAQSIVTTSMNLVGELIRIGTTLEETGGDWNMLLSFGLCATLSVTMFGQYFWYRANTEEFYHRQRQQQQQKKSQ